MTSSPPDFAPVEIDELDRKLAETAVRKHIPTMTTTQTMMVPPPEEVYTVNRIPRPATARRKPLGLEVPDYLATALKIKAAQESVTVRHLVLTALLDAGYDIKAVDMEEDGRRLR